MAPYSKILTGYRCYEAFNTGSPCMRLQHECDGRTPARNSGSGPHNDLIRYAAAMGNTRGLLPDDLSLFKAFAIRDGGTALVYFTPAKQGRFVDQDETSIAIAVRFLDWTPAEPVEETIIDQGAV